MVYGLWLIGGNCEKLLEGVNKEERRVCCRLIRVHHPLSQRVLNDLKGTRFSRRHMIWLLPNPLLPFLRQQVVSLSQSSFVSQVELILTGDGSRSQSNDNCETAESLVLYKSFNTLCPQLSVISGLSPQRGSLPLPSLSLSPSVSSVEPFPAKGRGRKMV